VSNLHVDDGVQWLFLAIKAGIPCAKKGLTTLRSQRLSSILVLPIFDFIGFRAR